MSALVAGFDAGGTSVRVRLVDAESGIVRAERQTRSAPDFGPGDALELVLPDEAPRVAVAVAGVSGISRPAVAQAWEAALRARLPRAQAVVEPDFWIALVGALPAGDGVLTLAGTGSLACAARGERRFRAGGRGWELSDEGSGAFLTAELARRTVRALDRIAPTTPLTALVCAQMDAHDAAAVSGAVRDMCLTAGRGFLVPLIARAAEEGDTEARDLLVGAANWLARLTWVAAREAAFDENEPLPVATAGGLWELGDWLTAPFLMALRRRFPRVQCQNPAGPPVAGATACAMAIVRGEPYTGFTG